LAAARALNLPSSWYKDLNLVYSNRRELVWEILDQIKAKYYKGQNGMFVWAKVGENFNNGEDLSNHFLYKSRIFITPGFVFGENGEKYIRISLCTNEIKLKEALNRLKNI
jgi:aspartate/methionine/tyrosine aminotransferase